MNWFQDVKSGECFRLDHLIKQHFEKKIADKKTTQEEKEIMTRKTNLLDGMTMVSIYILWALTLKRPGQGKL